MAHKYQPPTQNHSTPVDGIAIIGMSCLFPGAKDLEAYWENILNKFDAVSEPPAEAWDPGVYYDPDLGDADKVYCQRGGYLGSLVSFSPLAYGVPPMSVGGEPDQWLALKLAHDAMRDAGCDDLPEEVRHRTAVVLGKGTYLNGGNAIAIQRTLIIGQTLELIRKLNPEIDDERIHLLREEMKRILPPMTAETVPGLIPNIIVGRIANKLDLMGPTYTVDAACASSLIAVQLAMRDLLSGECDLALAGGSQVWMPVAALNVFCRLGALSRDEQIRPFDKDANGTLLGEGIGMVVLKRLADAERDGDRIYAVLRGVGVASDGRGVSVMAPRVDGEIMALRRAYEDAGVSPDSIGLIEAHGTATAVGDVVEVQALTNVFGQRNGGLPKVALGTVKSMISHTIPAAGVAGIIKTSMALHHKVLPPTLHVTEPNPKLELEKTPFYLNTEPRPWIHGAPEPRRAGVNAFGFGGINAHAVLEEYRPADPAANTVRHLPRWDSEVFIIGGDTIDAIRDKALRLTEQIERLDGRPEGVGALVDLAFTVNGDFDAAGSTLRLAIVAASHDDLLAKLDRAAKRLADPACRRIKDVSGIFFFAEPLGGDGKVALMFPGEGAQYQNMLADLCLHFPEVREVFDRYDRIFHDHPRDDVPSDYIFPRPAFNDEDRTANLQRLMQMDLAIEAVQAANQAMFALLQRLGLQGDACVGHSSGEYSAATAAGVFDVDSDEQFIALGRALYDYYASAKSHDGVPRATLLAIAAPRTQVDAIAQEAGGDIYLAVENCPHQAVLIGELAAAERARAIVERQGLIYEQLTYDRAVHTPLFEPYTADLRQLYEQVPVRPATIPLYSCATTRRYPEAPDEVREIFLRHWSQPVEFQRTIEALYDEGCRVFVEVGPRGNLSAFVEDILRGKPSCVMPANVMRRSGITQLNHLVGMLTATASISIWTISTVGATRNNWTSMRLT
ncbi:MAG: acyltransferase domain-containing protein [Thermomicrobiales bacterium]|nr:acyltransferase domain-containing protein [Thermomicrobiales bacterium]